MNAGRELDALVAEKVMGMVLPETLWLRPLEISPEQAALIILPAYSTSIAAAWEVVEKLCAGDAGRPYLLFSCRRYPNEPAHRWQADFCYNKELHWEQSETLPVAICLAALKAVGYNRPSEMA